MTNLQAARETVQALVLYVERPDHFLRISYDERGARILKLEASISWWEWFLSYLGLSSFNLEALINFLHGPTGFLSEISMGNTRDHEWSVINQAVTRLAEKVERYNNKGLRQFLAPMRLASLQAIIVPELVQKQLLVAHEFEVRLRPMHYLLTTKIPLEKEELTLVSQTIADLRRNLNLPHEIHLLDLVESLAVAHLECAKCPSYYNPYHFDREQRAIVKTHNNAALFYAFSKLLGYLYNKYIEIGKEEVGLPPFPETVSDEMLRRRVALYFETHAHTNERVRTLLFYSMLQQNGSIDRALVEGHRWVASQLDQPALEMRKLAMPEELVRLEAIQQEYMRAHNLTALLSCYCEWILHSQKLGHLLDSVRKLHKQAAAMEQFAVEQRFDLENLSQAIDTYCARTRQNDQCAGLTELYALTRAYSVRMSLYKETGEKDIDAQDLFEPVNEHEALLGDTLMLVCKNSNEFCLPEGKEPLSPRSAAENRNND